MKQYLVVTLLIMLLCTAIYAPEGIEDPTTHREQATEQEHLEHMRTTAETMFEARVHAREHPDDPDAQQRVIVAQKAHRDAVRKYEQHHTHRTEQPASTPTDSDHTVTDEHEDHHEDEPILTDQPVTAQRPAIEESHTKSFKQHIKEFLLKYLPSLHDALFGPPIDTFLSHTPSATDTSEQHRRAMAETLRTLFEKHRDIQNKTAIQVFEYDGHIEKPLILDLQKAYSDVLYAQSHDGEQDPFSVLGIDPRTIYDATQLNTAVQKQYHHMKDRLETMIKHNPNHHAVTELHHRLEQLELAHHTLATPERQERIKQEIRDYRVKATMNIPLKDVLSTLVQTGKIPSL